VAVGCWLLAFAVCVLEQCIDKAAAGGMAIALSAVIYAEQPFKEDSNFR
jgi:hypothetical protein